MTTLSANIDNSQTLIPISGPLTNGSFALPLYYTIDSEAIRVTGRAHRTTWLVDRGIAGTTKATHNSGATLTSYYPDAAAGEGGAGGLTVDNTVDPPAEVTTIIAPGAVIAGDEATLVTVAIYKRTTTLTNVQIKALPTTSIELVPAPGADKLLQLVFAIGVLDTQAAAYVAGTPGELSITHTDGGRRSVNYMESDQAAFASQALTHIWWLPSTSAITGEEFASTGTLRPNDALQLLNVNGADYTGGNAANTLKVTVWYGIVDL